MLSRDKCGSPARRARPGWPPWLGRLAAVVLLVMGTQGQAKYGGGSGLREEPYLIASPDDLMTLAADANDWSRHFKLAADIDLRKVRTNASCAIGDEAIPFSGTFDGSGRVIRHFTCIHPGCDRVGLFRYVRGINAEISNLRLVDPNVDADTSDYVGALVGYLRSGAVRHCQVYGAHVRGRTAVGMLVGWNDGTVERCTVQGEVYGQYSVGGLAGVAGWTSTIRSCSADVCVAGTNHVGGLIGGCTLAAIDWCSAAGHVSGLAHVGGLVGYGGGATIGSCYATASAAGDSSVGGLIGTNGPSCECSAGRVPGQVLSSYAAGCVFGDLDTGGLVGFNGDDCIVRDCFWDIEASGLAYSAGGGGLTTAQMQTSATFTEAGWGFAHERGSDEFWVIRRASQYPRPAWQIVAGDLDDDADVDWRDFSILALHWSGRDTSFWTGGADLSDDAWIDLRDLELWCCQWLAGDGGVSRIALPASGMKEKP